MILLCGFGVSNYYNKIKLVLLERGIEFQEKLTYPWQRDTFQEKSPLGKIPFIETVDGPLSESQAIIEYLEDRFPNCKLYPENSFARAKCRELIQHIELNGEYVARRLYTECFFGYSVSAEVKEEVYHKLVHNLSCIVPLLKFEPFIMGKDFTLVDCVAFIHFQMIDQATQIIYNEKLCERFMSELPAYLAMLLGRPHFSRVMEDRLNAIETFSRLNVPYRG